MRNNSLNDKMHRFYVKKLSFLRKNPKKLILFSIYMQVFDVFRAYYALTLICY